MAPSRTTRRAVRAARSRPRRIRLETDQRRAQLLALARAAFTDRAYDDVSIDDIAREAKISKGLLYHYFPTKRDLYVAGLREIADELVRAVTSVPADLVPIERARAGLDAYLDHITRHAPAYVSLMRGGIGSDPEVADVVDGVRRQLADTFLRDQPFAPLFVGNPRFETAVRGWIGFVEHATLEWIVNPRLSRIELREMLVELAFAMVQALAPPMFKPRLG